MRTDGVTDSEVAIGTSGRPIRRLIYIYIPDNQSLTEHVGLSATIDLVGGLDWCSFRTRYHTQVPEISGKLNGKILLILDFISISFSDKSYC
jgi:hypothetical protein